MIKNKEKKRMNLNEINPLIFRITTLWLISTISLFLFRNGLLEIVTNLNFYKYFYLSSNLTNDLLAFVILLLLCIGIALRSRTSQIFSTNFIIHILFLAANILLYSLIFSDLFVITYLRPSFQYFQLPLFLILVYLLKLWSIKNTNLENIEPIKGKHFIVDEPLSEANEIPIFYKKLSTQIIRLLPPAHNRKNSYAIGIMGSWGSGKTSFLQYLQKELQETKPNESIKRRVVFEFKPWLSDSPTKIINDFFQELKDQIKSPALSRALMNYASLLESPGNSLTSIIRNLLLINNNPCRQHEKVNRILDELNLEIIVFLDDLDRLPQDEILAILKLIRITLDSKHLTFILGYDKEKLNLNLSEINLNKNYEDKMITTEFRLPELPAEDLVSLLHKYVVKHLSGNQCHAVINLFKSLDKEAKEDFTDILRDNISTPRDVKRLVNSYLLTSSVIQPPNNFGNNVEMSLLFYQALFKLEIIKLKYFDIYQRLRNKDSNLLRLRNNHINFARYAQNANETGVILPGIDTTNPNRYKITKLLGSLFWQNQENDNNHYSETYKDIKFWSINIFNKLFEL